jgi:hypothetical protein
MAVHRADAAVRPLFPAIYPLADIRRMALERQEFLAILIPSASLLFNKEEFGDMGRSTKISAHDWTHLYTQFKGPEGDPVLCMVHNTTKKMIYFDVKANRLLTKQEARPFRADVTGLHVAVK